MASSVEFYFDSDDEEYTQNIEITIIRRSIRDKSDPLKLDDRTFKQNFRLSREAFLDLFQQIDNKLKLNIRQRGVPNILKLAAVLRFCSQGSYQLSVGNDFNIGVSQPTISLIFKKVFEVLENFICPKYIKFNYTNEEKRSAKIYFYQKSQIPDVIGCVDGSHIKIVCPKRNIRHLYYNRKGFYSINAMIVCDHKTLIRYINAKNPGASHDSNIWNISKLKAKLERDYRSGRNDIRILADSGYPLSQYLLTPYRNTGEGSAEATFNKKHVQGRNIIERTIGILKSRFRCLLRARELHYTPKKATQIINVCAALHNICITYRVENPEIIEEDENDTDNYILDDNNDHDNEPRLIRDRIRDNLRRTM